MKTKKLLSRIALTIFALCSACLFCMNGMAQKKAFNAKGKIYTIISASDISYALLKSGVDKISLNIYPVKSADGSKWELQTSFDDIKTVKAKFANTLPIVYYVPITKKFLENIDSVSFYYSPKSKKIEYFRLADAESKTDEQSKTGSKTDDESKASAQASRDSTPTICRCPPECCKLVVVTGGTAYKCPPDCFSTAETAQDAALNKTGSTKKNYKKKSTTTQKKSKSI